MKRGGKIITISTPMGGDDYWAKRYVEAANRTPWWGDSHLLDSAYLAREAAAVRYERDFNRAYYGYPNQTERKPMKSKMDYEKWEAFTKSVGGHIVAMQVVAEAKSNATVTCKLVEKPLGEQVLELLQAVPCEERLVYATDGDTQPACFNETSLANTYCLHPDWQPPEKELVGWEYIQQQPHGTVISYKDCKILVGKFEAAMVNPQGVVVKANMGEAYGFADDISAKNSEIIWPREES